MEILSELKIAHDIAKEKVKSLEGSKNTKQKEYQKWGFIEKNIKEKMEYLVEKRFEDKSS